MKKPDSTFTIEIEGGSTIIGISQDRTLSIALGDGKVYTAPITWVHQTMARKFGRENPTGRHPRRRRLLTHSDQMKIRKDDQ